MWFCPTFGRPRQAQRLLDAAAATGMAGRGLMILDGCDYQALRLPPNWGLHRRPERKGLCAALRWAFAAFPDESFYGLVADDQVPLTRHWDRDLEIAAGRDGISHCADGWRDGCRPAGGLRLTGAHGFGGDLLRRLGWWAPDDLVHLYIDDVWETVGQTLGCLRYRPEVVVEHRHFACGKAAFDATYVREIDGRPYAAADAAAFADWRRRWVPPAQPAIDPLGDAPCDCAC